MNSNKFFTGFQITLAITAANGIEYSETIVSERTERTVAVCDALDSCEEAYPGLTRLVWTDCKEITNKRINIDGRGINENTWFI